VKLYEAIKDTRTAEEVLKNPETDDNLKQLLKLAIDRTGKDITPTAAHTWETCVTEVKNKLYLWYNDKEHSTLIVGIDKNSKPVTEEEIREIMKGGRMMS
jgi:hypothetical protein